MLTQIGNELDAGAVHEKRGGKSLLRMRIRCLSIRKFGRGARKISGDLTVERTTGFLRALNITVKF